MKAFNLSGRMIFLFLFIPMCVMAQQKAIKVACIGNSITYGAFIPNRDKNSYPAQLQAYLGKDYEVQNFGVSGSTLLSKGDYPYISTQEYINSQKFQPDIVLIKLGTNDTKPQNWKYQTEFKNDYQDLINSYKALSSHPRIILLTPVRCFLSDESSINANHISNTIRPMIEEIAWKNNLEIINMFNLFGDQWQSHIMPDRLHPSSIGAGIMAKRIGVYLKQTEKQCDTEGLECLKESKPFNFHGFQGYDFDYEGTHCKIVKPYIEANGKPWVIRARFWGHEPQTDIELLEHGLHIVYCDVADLYGSDRAIERWDKFYRLMTANGFNKKVVLEGMSRGGLIVYNWAARNPEKVACIYADAPVMDFKSWPMGKGRSAVSVEDTQKLLTAYGFSSEVEALKWKKNPVDHAKKIAKAKIPCLHVVGDADQVVPVNENTAVFEKEMKKKKAPITVIHKAGVDHHPHSLNDPQPIVHFILSSIGLYSNECTDPIPGNEFRSTAGWIEGSDWYSVADDIKNTLKNKKLKLLLLGNSITQGWGGNRKSVTYKPGKKALDQVLGKDCWESAGISGDRTQNLIWRVRNDGYNCCQPDNIIIAIGINNLLSGNDTPQEIAEGIIEVTKEAEKIFPNANIILLGLLPAGKDLKSEIRSQCNEIHHILNRYIFTKAKYINPSGWFLSANGEIKEGLYSDDYVHLTGEGYKVMASEIGKLIK
ncbi:prolyl oligopeptidase family serine peptidase [Bacteroides fragilis]|nr:prolyl oligopeptidase family serine peptidase [Bacteroides fragilis]MCE9283769.1 prolyl oligopeptidase family serine peptidase [Bacteroides fragilis]